MQTITVDELKQRMDKGELVNLVDVRELNEHAEFNIGGTLLPLGEIRNYNTDSIDDLKDKEVIRYCRSGNRSGQATQILEQAGYTNVKNLVGGMLAWQQSK